MRQVKHELRPHQIVAIDGLREQLRSGKKRIVLMGACGFGKTTVAAEMIRCATERGKRSLFVADRIELINQTSARLDAEGLDHGVLQGMHPRTNYGKRIQVASIQTLARRSIPDADLVIIDECHTLHQAHIKLMEQWSNVPMIGLSATPWTKGLGKHFQGIVVAATTRELIDGGYLVEPTVYAPSAPDLSQVKTVRGDYDETQLGEVANQPKLVGDMVEHWLKLANGRPTLVFAVNIAHSKAIVERFQAVGVSAQHLDAYTDSDDRHDTIERFKRGEITLLSSVDILSKGFDYPGASCAIMARPTKSLMLHVQQQGRVLRTSPGKQDCLVLDHAGNTERLGFITDDLPVTLHCGNKHEPHERKEPLPKKCPSCSALRPAKVRKCPACGFEPVGRSQDIAHAHGELIVMKKGGGKIHGLDRERVYAELIGYARSKGMKDGYAWHKCRELFGSAPRSRPEPQVPSYETLQLIKHLAIKYAKSNKGRVARDV